jgi:glyoxalase family protein
VLHGDPHVRDGRLHLDFEDVDGTRLSLIDDGGDGPRGEPNPHTDVAPDDQIQGLGYSALTVADLAPTHDLLTRGLGLDVVRVYALDGHPTHVYGMAGDGPHAELHVTVRDDLPRARPGAGGVHHVALRVHEHGDMARWLLHLEHAGFGNSGLVDRHYFRSIYLRDGNGLVIELATDGPGFATDESVSDLGARLALPPFLEPRRATIEAHLRPLSV